MTGQPSGGAEAYARATRAVAARVDDRFEGPGDDVEASSLAAHLERNKFSRELLAETVSGELGEQAAADAEHRERRAERVGRVASILNDAGVEYATMKNLRAPAAMMSDVDLLIPDPGQQARAAKVLAADGYEFYKFRLLAHPRKFMAKRDPADPRPVDVYPDAIWIRKKVCDPHAVIERADDSGTRLPDPVDDLYLVATHAYSHLSVTFAELFHGARCVADPAFDWDRLTRIAHEYGTADALAVYLRLLDDYLVTTGRDPVPREVLESLRRGWMGRLVHRWCDRLEPPLSFPVELPLWLSTVASSVYHVPRVARRATPRETFKDLQSHYLTAASKALLGEA